jgi:regulator of sirC expression with transglutaminase-like and TPR domain
VQFAAPTALEYFATLVAEDASLPVLEAAAAVAQCEFPELDTQAVLAEVDGLGSRLKRRTPPDAAGLQRLRLLNHYFFEELGFAGNVNDYYQAANSYLHEVLRTRRGIPITLALLYLELAAQVGLQAHGVSFPGHFLVKLRLPGGEVLIDPFTGQSLSREDLEEKLEPLRQRHGLGGGPLPLALFLRAAAPREIVARMLRNLKAIHRSQSDWQRLLPVQERLSLLLPEDWTERRDLGLARAELGLNEEAARDIAAYLLHCPQAEDAALLRQRWPEPSRTRGLPRRLH